MSATRLSPRAEPILLEGGYYFEPDHAIQDHLIITPWTYTCPYKGTC